MWLDLHAIAPELPPDLRTLLSLDIDWLERITAALAAAEAPAEIQMDRARWLPLIEEPGKILCLGLNYRDHATETKHETYDYPIVFARFASSLVAHREPIILPWRSSQLDFEVELAVVIGKKGRNIDSREALSLVAGYSVFNDASIRDYQFKSSQWTMGKNFDQTGSFGPCFVTADELPPGAAGLRVQTRLNGVIMQDANTRDMMFKVPETIAFLSEAMTLNPGDVIIMGTPSGVGMARTPTVYMKEGDVCEVEIEGVGTLLNPIRQEEPAVG